jgi:cytochrome b
MNDSSASPVEASPAATAKRDVLIWDWPVRVGHWLMALSFACAYITAESERWRLVHVTFGYTLMGLVAFRIVWGLIGTRHARFSSFVRGPAAVKAYLADMLRGEPARHVGHNPAGALAIILLLGISLAVTASGWAVFNDLGSEWLEDAHEALATLMLLIVGTHISGVLISSRVHRENLVAAMVNGRKAAPIQDGIHKAWAPVAALILAAVLVFWWWQYQQAPAPVPGDQQGQVTTKSKAHDDDDD